MILPLASPVNQGITAAPLDCASRPFTSQDRIALLRPPCSGCCQGKEGKHSSSFMEGHSVPTHQHLQTPTFKPLPCGCLAQRGKQDHLKPWMSEHSQFSSSVSLGTSAPKEATLPQWWDTAPWLLAFRRQRQRTVWFLSPTPRRTVAASALSCGMQAVDPQSTEPFQKLSALKLTVL